jgi:hypothetical protein
MHDRIGYRNHQIYAELVFVHVNPDRKADILKDRSKYTAFINEATSMGAKAGLTIWVVYEFYSRDIF